MEPVYELNGYRVVDLTKVLDPKTETRRCHLIPVSYTHLRAHET